VVTAGTGYVVGDIVTITGLLLGGDSSAVNITLVATNFNANSTYGSTQIELDVSEQTDVILKTLFYLGLLLKTHRLYRLRQVKCKEKK